MQKINPCLWFDNKAEEAANFYVSVFGNSKIKTITHYGEGLPMPKGTVMTVSFLLQGQEFLALNGGPHFTFNPAVSFIVNCESQKEIDAFWEKLSAGGEPGQCGWLTDKYGLSWQIVPTVLQDLVSDRDPQRAQRVMAALHKMTKLDIEVLQRAYETDRA